jgi:hypothetical protein
VIPCIAKDPAGVKVQLYRVEAPSVYRLVSTSETMLQSVHESYEGWLISNAHSEISRKRDHIFKQMKVGSKVQYFSYKLTYLFFDMSFNTFFPT